VCDQSTSRAAPDAGQGGAGWVFDGARHLVAGSKSHTSGRRRRANQPTTTVGRRLRPPRTPPPRSRCWKQALTLWICADRGHCSIGTGPGGCPTFSKVRIEVLLAEFADPGANTPGAKRPRRERRRELLSAGRLSEYVVRPRRISSRLDVLPHGSATFIAASTSSVGDIFGHAAAPGPLKCLPWPSSSFPKRRASSHRSSRQPPSPWPPDRTGP